MGKYEEALERAKELHQAGNALTKAQMEIVFPVLKGSEDEKIRKELIGHCKDLVRMNKDDKVMLSVYEPWLVWLEKQKEQKPAEWSKEEKEVDLEKEIDEKWDEFVSSEGEREDFTNIARHFAGWGATHLKK